MLARSSSSERTAVSSEHLASPHHKTHLGAVIWLAGRMTAMRRDVRDLSETRLRLRTEGAASAPERFELALGRSAVIEEREVVRRRADEPAARFVRQHRGRSSA